jgi:hypothetical protein
MTGPAAPVIADIPDHVPIARPRSFSGNEAPMIARLPGTSRAAPIPCIARAKINSLMSRASPHATEATANIAIPSAKTRRRP